MATKICFSNQKGGVGKTTSAQHLISYLTNNGYRVLALDLDPQANLSLLFNLDFTEYEGDGTMEGKTVYQLMKGKAFSDVVLRNVKKNLDFICGSLAMATADGEFSGLSGLMRIKTVLSEVENDYDFVIIDCSPALGQMTTAALIAADGVIIPYQVGSLTKVGGVQLFRAIRSVKEGINSKLKVYGVLVTMYDTRTNSSKKAVVDAQELAEILETKVFDAKIRLCSKMKELAEVGKDIFEYAPKSTSACDYKDFAEELLKEIR